MRLVDDLGFLDERMLVIHAIWVDDADMDLLAAAGCTVAHNPICNLRLGSGIMPFRALRDRGITIAIGTDERAADDTVNCWAALKQAGWCTRSASPTTRFGRRRRNCCTRPRRPARAACGSIIWAALRRAASPTSS